MTENEYIIRLVRKEANGKMYAEADDMIILVIEGEGEAEKKHLSEMFYGVYNNYYSDVENIWAEQIVVKAAHVNDVLLKKGDLIR